MEMSGQKADIIIVGGGPAGSTAALYLSQLGYDIILIEKKLFPRETLCGEFLSKEVTDILKDLGVFDDFISLKPNKINSFRSVDADGIELKADLKFEAYAMKRSVFDSFLLKQTKLRNVQILQPAEVISITKTNSGFICQLIDGSNNQISVKSKIVIAGYGKQNTLDKKVYRNFIYKKSNLNGIKFHLPVNSLKSSIKDEIRIYTDDELYCGINQVSDTEATVCFLENRKKSKIPSRERLIEVIKSNKHFQKSFSEDAINHISNANIHGTGNIYFGKKEVVEGGVIMVGDAARVISPLAGDGIGMAMESSKLLYNIFIKHNIDQPLKIFSDYRSEYEKTFSTRLLTAKIIQSIIFKPNLRKAGFNFVNKYPSLLPYMIKFTRNLRTT